MCGSLSGKECWKLTDGDIACAVNDIGSEGARALADALKVNHTVTEMDLGGECSSGIIGGPVNGLT